ncbi:hypothetical protein EJ04DRAFT_556316 [Polyplosphaeria fusca]|uniref:Zn(2)-C6 fungal-type domain-containing protein n=1 Tax=Polyplosphaeria fusca TaxID=682080 RepID=A0A9P4QKR0_9PLEO|nr:hypothetical protein EJ04DRAFT_556316 [Polyplosphaeria fusca]
MPSRRHHTKTRSGCSACKARRVKCDENRPVCKHCIRRGTECSYPLSSSAIDVRPETQVQDDDVQVSHDAPSGEVFDAMDLMLMHRFCTSTSLNLFPSLNQHQQHVWQIVVPAKAESYRILRHGILSLAALDLAVNGEEIAQSTTPKSTYHARSLHHQQISLSLFQDLLKDESNDAKEVAFLFSVMLAILAFGSIHSVDAAPTTNDVFDHFALFRGPRALWQFQSALSGEELVESLFPGGRVHSPRDGDSDDKPFPELDALCLDSVCADAVAVIRRAWIAVQLQPDNIRAMGYFPAMMSQDFCKQAREGRPNALTVMRYQVPILKKFENIWWVGPWHKLLESAIDGVAHRVGI